MRSYRSKRTRNHGVKAKKIIFRILFVLIAAIIIAVLTIMLGNHLLKKVEKLENEENITPADTEQPAIDAPEEYIITSTVAPSVFAVTVDVRDYEDTAALGEKIADLSLHYDTLIIRLDDGKGGLIYSSPAVCSILGLPVAEEDSTLEVVRSAIKTAKNNRMRLCAVIPSSLEKSSYASASVIDSALIAELAGLGFDEVMIQFSGNGEFNCQTSLSLQEYLLECDEKTLSACLIGVTLPAEYYVEASYAKYIQTVASATSFLGINFSTEGMTTTTEIFSSVSHEITTLLGSFTVYNMRLIIDDGDIAAVAAEYTASVHSNIENVCIMGTYLPDEMAYDQNASVDIEETTPETNAPETESPENPYASTGDYYGNGDNTKETSPVEDDDKSDKPWW